MGLHFCDHWLYNHLMSIEKHRTAILECSYLPDDPQNPLFQPISILNSPSMPEKKIRFWDAKRSAYRLLKGLKDLGAIPSNGKVVAENIIPRDDQDTKGFTIPIVSLQTGIVSPNEVYVSESINLRNYSSRELLTSSYFAPSADLSFDGQSFRMFFVYEPLNIYPYRLSLGTYLTIPNDKEMLLETLPTNFTTVGFAYDFVNNPEYRERLSEVSKKRIPMQAIRKDFGTSAIGHITEKGISTQVNIFLQTPNPRNFATCYEVEIFDGQKKNADITPDVAPEAVWQEKEQHYCMTEKKGSYPFIPIELERISKLSVRIHYKGDFPQMMPDLLGDVPLSIDGTTKWFSRETFEDTSFNLLYNPTWGENNTALTYRQISQKRISPYEIVGALTRMNSIRDALKEKLAIGS